MLKTRFLAFFILSYVTVCSVVAQTNSTNAQSNTALAFSIKGTIKDTVNFSNTAYASVSILRASDSILQSFTRTDENGDFTLHVDSPIKYLLLVAHPSFAIYVEEVNVQNRETKLEPILMTSKRQMLQEVIITDAKAIVLKGDTIEYKADSFQTRAFDNVDELLKKLPGIEIGKDGKIKAYGQEVKKMTVDGEEFFSDDPAIVSKTLRASAIDKVQVFDKKSDQAIFSGVDDGEKIKTINLKLKDDAKKGCFGKLKAGGGAPGYWDNEAMLNDFKGKRKIAAYGIMSNTNTNGLGWQDENKFGGSNTMSSDEDGDVFYYNTSDDDDWGGQFRGAGLPKAWVGGGLYNNKWMDDSLKFSGNYRFTKKIAESEEQVSSQYILPDTEYFSNQHTKSLSMAVRHNISTATEYLPDTSSSLKVNLNGGYNTVLNKTNTQSQSMDRNGTLINSNNSDQQNQTSEKKMDAEMLYKKRFHKKGRTFTADLKGKWTEGNGNGTLQSNYALFALDSSYALNQHKVNNSNSIAGEAKLTYTEPLSKALNLQFNYSSILNNSDVENNSYDRPSDNTYTDVFNPLYSSHFKLNINQNQGGIGLRYNAKKINASIGSNLSDTRFKQEDRLFDTTYHYNYVNLLPMASFRYNKSQTTSFDFRYNGRAQQPTMTQLQPLRNNNDPLNITIGNPDLKQAYIHDVSLSYNTYKMLSQQYINVNGSVNFLQNDVSMKQTIDDNGRSLNQFVNVNGNYNAWLWAGFSRKIKDFRAYFQMSSNYNHQHNFINGLGNVNNQLNLNPTLDLSYSKDTTIDLSYSFSPGYNMNQSSIRTDVVTKYWMFVQKFGLSMSLPLRFRVGTDATLNLRQKLNPAETNNNSLLWNVSLSRTFFKDRSLEAKVYINDVLNQNVGYNRSNTATYISEKTYNTIKRYAMFSLTWNFTKMGGKPKGTSVSEGTTEIK